VWEAAIGNSVRFLSGLAVSLVLMATASSALAQYCKKGSGVAAVDMASPVDQPFLDKMKEIGVGTIIRYYDWDPPTLLNKTLLRPERDLIVENGFKLAVVFQHFNNKFASFTPARGKKDAQRSLELAQLNSQPKGSAIYFGVDGPWGSAAQLKNIKAYFTALNETLAGKGYRIGAYGSGLVCRKLLDAKLAELCWLANAQAWPGYKAFYKSGEWRLVQTLPGKCGGKDVDFNFTNDRDSDFGQFGG
jgi:hypothetical protein